MKRFLQKLITLIITKEHIMRQSEIDTNEFATPKLFDLEGKVALITGASGALGGQFLKILSGS